MKLQLAIVAAALVMAVQAQAAVTFDLVYSDLGGNVANGQIIADHVSGNTYTAVGGFLNLTASSIPSLVGNYNLLAGSGPSPLGSFVYDNQLTYPGDPYLTVYGLLGFAGANREINLWGNSAGNYSLWAWEGNTSPNTYPDNGSWILKYDGLATTSLTPVPEPTTVIAGALLLLPFAASTIRRFRKNS